MSRPREPEPVPTVKLRVPYFVWRDGRPRWSPGPGVRALGFRAQDLKDGAGAYLGLESAIEAARALNAAVAKASGRTEAPKAKRAQSVARLVEDYFLSPDFARLAEATRRDYRLKGNAILYERRSKAAAAKRAPQVPTLFSKAPAGAIGKPEAKMFYEAMIEDGRSLAMARGAMMVLSAAYQWGSVSTKWRLRQNPCQKLRLPSPDERLRIALETEIRALDEAAAALELPSIADAVYVALFTGQRESDVIALVEPFGDNRSLAQRAAAGEPIRFVQKKTNARVAVFATTQLAVRLADADRRRRALHVVPDAIVVSETAGDAYPSGDAFRRAFARVRALAAEGDAARGLAPCPSVASLQFRDLRDTAVTWMGRAGATVPQIAAITGHSLKGIHTILKHYLELDESMAREAIVKLQAWIEAQGIRL